MAGSRAPIRLPLAYRDLLPTFDALQREALQATDTEVSVIFERTSEAQLMASTAMGLTSDGARLAVRDRRVNAEQFAEIAAWIKEREFTHGFA